MKRKSKFKISITFLILFLLTLISAYAFYKIETKNKMVLKDKINSNDFNYLYGFYITRIPNLGNRFFFGNENASINLIAYLDLNSESSRYFISETFPNIENEYIKPGKIKFFHKNYVTFQDFKEKNENFMYAVYLTCAEEIKREVFWNFYFDLFNSEIKEMPSLLEKYGIPTKEFDNCLKNPNLEKIKEDVSEVENFYIVGMNPKFYIGIGRDNRVIEGVPNYNKFKRIIRQYQLVIGD